MDQHQFISGQSIFINFAYPCVRLIPILIRFSGSAPRIVGVSYLFFVIFFFLFFLCRGDVICMKKASRRNNYKILKKSKLRLSIR